MLSIKQYELGSTLEEWEKRDIARGQRLNVMLVGINKQGKSTLVNNLKAVWTGIFETVATPGSGCDTETRLLHYYDISEHLRVYDTRGLVYVYHQL